MSWWGHRIAGANQDEDDPFRVALQAEIARRRRRQFMQLLVRELSKVAAFQMVYYTCFFIGGLYNLFIAHGEPPLTLQGVPSLSVQLWLWLNIFGPTFGTLGIRLEKTQFNYASLFVQIGGNLMFAWSLIEYILATLHAEPWGHGMYGAFLAASALASTSGLILRDGLRVALRRSAE